MSKYEITFIFAKDKKDYIKTLDMYLKDINSKIIKKDDWGVKTFAYPIKKLTEGRYMHYQIEVDGAGIKALESKLKLDEVLLRHLIVKL